MGTFRPPKIPLLKAYLDFKKFLDQDHFVCESKVYFAVAFLCLIDLTFVVFLPWNDSKFAKLSKGFPNIIVFRVVFVSLILTAIISFIIQVSYLSTTTFSVKRDLMFLMNISLLGIKVILILLEFVVSHFYMKPMKMEIKFISKKVVYPMINLLHVMTINLIQIIYVIK